MLNFRRSDDERLQKMWRKINALESSGVARFGRYRVKRISSSYEITRAGIRLAFAGPDYSGHWDEMAYSAAERLLGFRQGVTA